MKFFVRTIEERNFNYAPLEYQTLVDKLHQPVQSYIEQLECLSTIDDDVVLLEDDLKLCNNFEQVITQKIKEVGADKIINFFYHPAIYITSGEIKKQFCWTQCVYYPKGTLSLIIQEMKRLNFKCQYDVLQGKAMKNLGLTFYTVRPCIVQHLDEKSYIQSGYNCHGRSTPWFVDDIKDLDYNDKDLMEKRRLEYCKFTTTPIKYNKYGKSKIKEV